MTQEQKDLVINHIATIWTNAQNGDTQAWDGLWNRMIKKATIMSATGVENRYDDDFDLCKTDERRVEVAANFAEVILQYFKVRELEKLGKELEAAERERKEAESRAKVEAQNDAEQTVYAQVENEVERREADARIEYAIKQFGRYTQEACAVIRAIEIKKEHKPFEGNSVVGMRLAAAWQASAQQSDRSAFCALLARINAPEWLVDFLASGRCWMISPLTAARLMIDHCDVEALEAEQDVYDAVRAYLLSNDVRVLSMVDDDVVSELAAMQRSLMRELYLEEAVALVLNAQKESTENRDAQENVESFPVAVEYLRDRFLKCYDDVEIYGYSMILPALRCRLAKDEEAWREVEDKFWDQFKYARQRNRRKGTAEGEYEIAQEFAEAVLPFCKPDELEKLEPEIEEEKKRAAICEECVEIEQRLMESAETKVEKEEARARIWYAGDQFGYRKDQQRLDALRAIELCKEHKTASERVVKRLRAARESYDLDAFNALLERVNAPEWLRVYLTNNVSYGVYTKDAVQLMIDCCDVEKLEATDDDFAIDPRDAYVETMKAVAVEDMEEPEDVELDEYIKEYRAAHKETRARSLVRSLRDFLWTRGFSLDDVGKAEWWQTVALRWPSLDEFVAVAKAGGLKNIDKYLRRGLRKANKRRAVRALLRIARAYAETCL